MGTENNAVKTFFRNRPLHYFSAVLFGISGGLLVALCFKFPSGGLWAAAYFSSSVYGFWMFTAALLVLWSEKRSVACINAGLYIFFMFFVTTVCMSVRLYKTGNTPFQSFQDMALHSIGGWLVYSIPPAILCAALACVLWSGRKNTVSGAVLRWMPMAFIALETVYMFWFVFAQKTRLFPALADLLCAAGYFMLILFPMIDKRRIINRNGFYNGGFL